MKKPPIHKEGDNAILCREQLLARQKKQPDFVATILSEANQNRDGDYVINHYRLLELLNSPIVQPSEWPKAFIAFKALAKPGDRGLGDIIARVIGPIGGDIFKQWYLAIFGKSCGCDTRQEAWNKRYPL